MKHVVTVQDISCVGRCSLTVALPVLSAMGVQTSVLPTAVLSTHTRFPDPAVCDLTEQIPAIAAHWKRIGVRFDGIYTGYLGSVRQLSLISDFMDDFGHDAFIFIDPVMADHGRLYAGFSDEYVLRMRAFCTKADVIVPNITEACLLLGIHYCGDGRTEEEIRERAVRLTELGVRQAVVTGVRGEPDRLGAVAYDSGSGTFFSAFGERISGSFHGTGDLFASVCVGSLANGRSLGEAIAAAVDFTCACIRQTPPDDCGSAFGVNFEAALPSLILPCGRASATVTTNRSFSSRVL